MIVIEIAGHVGRDPETRFTPNGQKVTSFSIASTLKRGSKEETIWVRVTVWGDRFDKMMPYIKKGSALIVIGELSQAPQIYTDKNGDQQVSIDMTAEMLRFSPFGRGDRQEGGIQQPGYAAAPATHFGHQESFSGAPYGAQQQTGRGNAYNPYGGQQGVAQDEDPLPF